MFGKGKIIGPILIIVGIGACFGVAAIMAAGYLNGQLKVSSAVVWLTLCGLPPLFLFGGVGAYLTINGRKEEAELEVIRKKERLLGLIQAQGQVSVGPIMVELKMTREEVTNAILELVAMGLFTGYIDWKALTFYSQDAKAVGSNQCPNCGGVREFVGKGVIKCPYCDVSLFIPPDAPQTAAEPKPPQTGA